MIGGGVIHRALLAGVTVGRGALVWGLLLACVTTAASAKQLARAQQFGLSFGRTRGICRRHA